MQLNLSGHTAGLLLSQVDRPGGHVGFQLQPSSSASSSAAGGLSMRGQHFEFRQFHFHSPSEHTIAGQHLPLELHILHALPANEDTTVLVSVLFNYSSDGSHNSLLSDWWWELFRAKEVSGISIDALIEQGGSMFWSYPGSLTTPPCTEGATWLVFLSSVGINRVQEFSYDYALNGIENYRGTQPLNGRVLRSFSL
jgi:carbonic anhydrase